MLDHHAIEKDAAKSEREQKFLHVMRSAEAFANLTEMYTPRRYSALRSLLERYSGSRSDECQQCFGEAIARTVESCRLFSIQAPDDAMIQGAVRRLMSAITCSDDQPESDTSALPLTDRIRNATGEIPSANKIVSNQFIASNKLMVIDDDIEIIDFVRVLLAETSVEVLGGQSAVDAISLAGQANAVLCDVHLGKSRGVDVIRQLRDAGFTGPVIMFSGDRSRATVEECIAMGIKDYLLKPFSRRILLEKLQKHTHLLAGAGAEVNVVC